MNDTARSILRHGALLGLFGVAAGTFGAHGLKHIVVTAEALDWWRTGVLYHLVHALALVAVGILARAEPTRALRVAGICFLVGTLIFSGSLYALALGAPRWFGAITPIGGLGFLAGWIALSRA